ncbi:hypothetical protein CCUG62472_03212 [Mycobacteroides salmoniphilum]|uniref:Uncharacterized protein n=1 Tax=Mycobacteroides salmoniphilum TaxID=404941 RepID=A0A4R8SYJ6_9MYCO|nr:hypothetical protein CCUG62472_03212 [Mycobacteroides salmoniphilum]TEA08430.1 hypothetical protein CCUG60884_00914 [Mycobacteroides salmoniphilum]
MPQIVQLPDLAALNGCFRLLEGIAALSESQPPAAA